MSLSNRTRYTLPFDLPIFQIVKNVFQLVFKITICFKTRNGKNSLGAKSGEYYECGNCYNFENFRYRNCTGVQPCIAFIKQHFIINQIWTFFLYFLARAIHDIGKTILIYRPFFLKIVYVDN